MTDVQKAETEKAREKALLKVKGKFKLTDREVEKIKLLHMNPETLLRLPKNPTEKWKEPVALFIDRKYMDVYRKDLRRRAGKSNSGFGLKDTEKLLAKEIGLTEKDLTETQKTGWELALMIHRLYDERMKNPENGKEEER